MHKITSSIIAFIAITAIVSAGTVTYSGVTTPTTGYTNYQYIVNFKDGSFATFGYVNGGGSMFAMNGANLNKNQYANHLSEANALYETYKTSVTTTTTNVDGTNAPGNSESGVANNGGAEGVTNNGNGNNGYDNGNHNGAGNQEPVVVPPVVEPPVVTPPVVTPPVEEPVVETPVVEQPPVVTPPVEEPVVETPVVEQPPVVTPPVEEPVVEQPPVVTPPVEEPVVETPVVDNTPVVETPAPVVIDENTPLPVKEEKEEEVRVQDPGVWMQDKFFLGGMGAEYTYNEEYQVVIVYTTDIPEETGKNIAQRIFNGDIPTRAVIFADGYIVYSNGTVKHEKVNLNSAPAIARLMF